MADQQTPEISDTDIESLAQKLEHFAQTLTPGEHAALAEVFVRATPEGEDDVQGYAYKGALTADAYKGKEAFKGKETFKGKEAFKQLYTAQAIRFILVGGHLGMK